MYTHVYIYIYIYIHTYVRTYIHTCMHARMHASIHTYMYACIHTYIYRYIHTYLHTYIHTYIPTYMHACTHACIHTCIHTFSQKSVTEQNAFEARQVHVALTSAYKKLENATTKHLYVRITSVQVYGDIKSCAMQHRRSHNLFDSADDMLAGSTASDSV